MRVKFALFCAVLLAACDSNVAGITFESGFLVDEDAAWSEGFDAGVVACRSDERQFVKYKSGTSAAVAWTEGYYSALHAACPEKSR